MSELNITNRKGDRSNSIFIPDVSLPAEVAAAKKRIEDLQGKVVQFERALDLAHREREAAAGRDEDARLKAIEEDSLVVGSPEVEKAEAHIRDLQAHLDVLRGAVLTSIHRAHGVIEKHQAKGEAKAWEGSKKAREAYAAAVEALVKARLAVVAADTEALWWGSNHVQKVGAAYNLRHAIQVDDWGGHQFPAVAQALHEDAYPQVEWTYPSGATRPPSELRNPISGKPLTDQEYAAEVRRGYVPPPVRQALNSPENNDPVDIHGFQVTSSTPEHLLQKGYN